MIKIYKTLLWVLAASACIVILSIRPQAAEYKLGPGDRLNADGSIVSLNGTLIVNADGTKVKDPFGTDNGSYTVIGNGSGRSGQDAVSEILNDVNAADASESFVTVDDTDTAGQSASEAESDGSTASLSSADGTYSFEGTKYKKSSLYGKRRLTGYAESESGTAMTVSGKKAKPAHTAAAPSDIPLGSVIIVEGAEGPYASRYNGVYVVEDRGGAVLEAQGLIDLFFASDAEASAVTAGGWNYANIWIAEAVQ